MAVDKETAWNYALAMNKMAGLEPSEEMLELIEKEKRGEITTEDIRKILDQKYKSKEGELG